MRALLGYIQERKKRLENKNPKKSTLPFLLSIFTLVSPTTKMTSTLDIIIANSPGKTVNVPYKPNEPIFFLFKRIQDRLGSDGHHTPLQDLFLDGKRLTDHNQTMHYYRIFGHTLTYRTGPSRSSFQDKINLHVQTLTGKTIHLNCGAGILVEHVKHLVQGKEGIPPDQQRLVFMRMVLEGRLTLLDYGIQNNSTLFLILKLRGGGTLPAIEFSDVSDASGVYKIQFSETAPRGRVTTAGTNVECQCRCTPTHRVICMMGKGSVELSRDILTCPNCGRSDGITPITVGFVHCKYKFYGIKAANGEQYTSEWKNVRKDDDYQLFNPDKRITWRRLVIESAGMDQFDECAICLEPLQKFQTLSCGHRFHAPCVRKWPDSCPCCRYNRHLISDR
jgi:hypothetical protein